jgi:hypothetical protein
MAPGRGLFSLFAAWFPGGATIFRPYLWGDIMHVSRGKHRLLSAHDRQIYVTRPYDGYRTSSCVADSSRLCPASNPPALYPLGYGAYLYVDPRFCLRLPSGAHRCYTLAFGYPSPPSGWVWTLPDICVINIGQHHLAAGPCPAHNDSMQRTFFRRFAAPKSR